VPTLTRRAGVELARTGRWKLGTGEWAATAQDFAAAIAATKCPAIRRPYLRVGHTDPRFGRDGDPALGWLENLRVGPDGHTLLGDYTGVPQWLDDVMATAYPDRSIEGAYNRQCQLGHKHPFVLDGVALLGVTRPGVGTLESLADVRELFQPPGGDPDEVPIAATIPGIVWAHLPGQHDQKDHGRRKSRPDFQPFTPAQKRERRQAARVKALEISARTAEPKAVPKVLKDGGKVKPALDRSAAGEDLSPAQRADLLESMVAAYTFEDKETGLAVRPTEDSVEFDRGQVTLNASVYDEHGQQVGEVSRIWMSGSSSGVIVDHDYFRLQADVQGGGFARRFNDHAENAYREMGADSIELLANVDVGGYAWAKQGYEFVNPSDPPYIARRMAPYVEKMPDGPAKDSARATLARVTPRDVHAGTAPSPLDLAMVGWEPGAETWPGKEAMLGSSWSGTKRLAPPVAASASPDVLRAVSAWHAAWTSEYADQVAVVPADRHPNADGHSDYNEHHHDISAPADVTDVFWVGVEDLLAGNDPGSGGDTVKAAVVEHTGAMIALVPSVEDAERLAVDGGEPVNELHVTLAYLGDAADIPVGARVALIADVTDAADGWGALDAEAFAVSAFNPNSPDRDPCIVLGLGGGGLDGVQTMAAIAASDASKGPDGWDMPEPRRPWIPHLTLVYTDDLSRVAELADRTGPITFDRIRVAFAGEHTDIPLTAAPVAASEGTPMPNPVPSRADLVREAWNARAPYSQYVHMVRGADVIVLDEDTRTFLRVPVTVDGEAVEFGEPVKVMTDFVPMDELVAASAVTYASRAESRPEDLVDAHAHHNQKSHGNRAGKPNNVPAKSGLGAKADADRVGTNNARLDDEVEFVPHSSNPHHPLKGKRGRVISRNDPYNAHVDFGDGKGWHELHQSQFKVTRTGRQMEKEDRAKLDRETAEIERRHKERQKRVAASEPDADGEPLEPGEDAVNDSEEPDAVLSLDEPPTDSPAAEPDPNTEPNEEGDPVSTLSTDVRSRLGLAEDADDVAVLAALDALKVPAAPAEPDPETVAASAAAEKENLELRAEVKLLAEQVQKVSAELAETKAAKAETVKASVLDDAMRQGKFAPADRERWLKDYDDAPSVVTRILASIAPGTAVPVHASGYTGEGDVTASAAKFGDISDADMARFFTNDVPAKSEV
jgi:hypothetical protein